ncbi:hypothetical protein HanXRQr2_Chr05g0237021 [Helianthus annuus]|uniref:Uncharacterized protein n=1 Tax=Helianthus annuus TaxID=4232 RepID=A0A9K3NP89_HELAN|nr:hypothetical protein HanXRQr2_Chr05g0237021 [Helianthus annuus]
MMEVTSRMKMARFQTFWIQMRKNKPLDKSRETGQTSGTKMAFYSTLETIAYLIQDVIKQMLLKIRRHTISGMAIVNGEKPEFMVIYFHKPSNMIILHWMISFSFDQVKPILDITFMVFSLTGTIRRRASSELCAYTQTEKAKIRQCLAKYKFLVQNINFFLTFFYKKMISFSVLTSSHQNLKSQQKSP